MSSHADPALLHPPPRAPLRHVVLLRFADGIDEAAVAALCAAFVALRDAVPGVRALEWGCNQSPEGLDRGFTHAFTLSFDDCAARDAYLVQPAHQAFVARLQPALADVLVVDYRAASAGLQPGLQSATKQ